VKAPKDMDLDELAILFSELLKAGDKDRLDSVFHEVLYRLCDAEGELDALKSEGQPRHYGVDTPYPDGTK